MKNLFYIILISANLFSCVSSDEKKDTDEKKENNSNFSFENSIIELSSTDALGNVLFYPEGEVAITSTIMVWKPGFETPWHFHPFTGPAFIVQGELTVDFDTTSALSNLESEKTSNLTKVFKAGDSFLAIPDVWHKSHNYGSKDLIFTVSWLGEKGKSIKVLSN